MSRTAIAAMRNTDVDFIGLPPFREMIKMIPLPKIVYYIIEENS
jgi:hypothetical protein